MNKFDFRAYVVHADPTSLKTQSDKIAFAESIRSWVQSKVARHKYLRGGAFKFDLL